MIRLSHQLKRSLAIMVTAVAVTGYWPGAATPVVEAGSGSVQDSQAWVLPGEPTSFITEAVDTGASCRDGTTQESGYFTKRDPDLILRPLEGFRPQADDGLHITLRSTPQLDGFPLAKTAFLKAAATWESLVQAPITIIIDVDFGPMRFGQPYPANVIGATATQNLFNSIGYISLRSRLIAGASDAEKAALYSALPNPSIVTDSGTTTAVLAPSATLRMIGEIAPIANPAIETNFGPPPSIGFNSAFDFDFDPTDGIDSDKLDFDSVAVHEIGHALGFSSQAGAREISPATPLAVSVWDIFRFRPGITLNAFTSALRVQSSGGDQVFFAGGSSLALSTGRPDGSGGDGRQSSHWKDDGLSNQYIGVMDPTLAKGFRAAITANDLAAVNAMGYRLTSTGLPEPPPVGNNPPLINSLAGGLNGDTLTLSVDAADPDGDLAQAQLTLLNDSNGVVHALQPTTLATDPSPTRKLNFSINGMGLFPTALRMSVALVDSRGNRSATSTLDFSLADPGAPDLRVAIFDTAGSMTIKGGPFASPLQLEINGVVVGPPLKIKIKGGAAKLLINASQSDLNLRSGANRIRVLSSGLRSKIFVLTI